ncbi:MAG: LysR family transcriptional regulator [Sporomusaceae bacterium]|nr:LysR family transcriptional regulator [Sporomusaceae bacterium]
METRDWQILSVLYEQKNITKTAHSLFISQPALTARLRQIEKEFGITIVNRTSKGVQFTPQGEYLAKSSTEMLLKIRKMKEQVLNLDDDVKGTLRLGASGYFTAFTLPPLLKQFKQQYPQVEFIVHTDWTKNIFNTVFNQEVHIGFVSADYGWQSEKHMLFEESIYVASADDIALTDLPSLPRINYQTDGLIKAQIDKWWRENYSQPPTISMEVDKLATCKEMVRYGLGYAIMPGRILHDMPHMRKAILNDRQGKPIRRNSWMIYHADDQQLNVIRAFVNFIKAVKFTQY